MNPNAYRDRAERGEVQLGTWVTMIRTPAVLTLLRAAGLSGSTRLALLAPGAAFGWTKRWPAERLGLLADRHAA